MTKQWNYSTTFDDYTVTYDEETQHLHWDGFRDEYAHQSGGGTWSRGKQHICDFLKYGAIEEVSPDVNAELKALAASITPNPAHVPLSVVVYFHPIEVGISVKGRTVAFKNYLDTEWYVSIDELSLNDWRTEPPRERILHGKELLWTALPAGSYSAKVKIRIEESRTARHRPKKRWADTCVFLPLEDGKPQTLELHLNLSAEGVVPLLKRFVVDATQIQNIKRALRRGWRLSKSYYSDYHGSSATWEERNISFEDGIFRDKSDSNRGESYVFDRRYQEDEFTRQLQQDEDLASVCLEALRQQIKEKSEQIVKALEGKEFYSGGEDYRCNEVTGGEWLLRKEGDAYYFKDASWSTALGRREIEARLSPQELREKLMKDDGFFDFCEGCL